MRRTHMMRVGGCVLTLVLAVGCGESAELQALRKRVDKVESDQALLLQAMNSTAQKMDAFLRAVQGEEPVAGDAASGVEAGGEPPEITPAVSEPSPETPAGSGRIPVELWLPALAAALALGALLWNRRSRAVVDRAETGTRQEVSREPGVRREVSVALDAEPVEGVCLDKGAEATCVELPVDLPGEPVGDLCVENVGRGELGLANVAPVELDEPWSGRAARRDRPPCSVQWRLPCADPEAGSRLAQDLLSADPRVLTAPAPRIEPEARSLRVGYHVHPDLTLADRSQIAARLVEVLRSVPPGVRGGAAGRS